MTDDGVRTAALVGATGGAGTTRLCVETATMLARGGRDVAVLDAAYATQGLAGYVPGPIDPDVTALCLAEAAGETPLGEALVDIPADVAGRIACCPAFAPFERVARAMTPEAARRFEARIEEAATGFDHVVVDVPPVAANQAIAAVTTADRLGLVAPATERGTDALPRAADRLADLDAGTALEVATRGPAPDDRFDHCVPASDASAPADAPAATGRGAFVDGVREVVEDLFDVALDVETSGGIRGFLPR